MLDQVSFASARKLPRGFAAVVLQSLAWMRVFSNATMDRTWELIELLELHGGATEHPVLVELRAMPSRHVFSDTMWQNWVARFHVQEIIQLILDFAQRETEDPVCVKALPARQ